tara:strand:+ start:4999 stop:5676 length:678 start_codon:yes stop_codon:yes gene_type:complete
MVAAKQSAARKAMAEAQTNARTLRRLQDKMWNEASHAPMFYREYEKVSKDEKGKVIKKSIVRRSARLVNGHAFCIAAAGAASAVVREMRLKCSNMGIDYESTTACPCLPMLAKGTKMVLEQFLAAYVQEAVLNAMRTMTSIGKHKRLNGKMIKGAFEEVNEQIFTAAGPAPRATIVIPLSKATKKKATVGEAEADEGGGDYEAGAEPDEAAEDAAMGEEAAAEEA